MPTPQPPSPPVPERTPTSGQLAYLCEHLRTLTDLQKQNGKPTAAEVSRTAAEEIERLAGDLADARNIFVQERKDNIEMRRLLAEMRDHHAEGLLHVQNQERELAAMTGERDRAIESAREYEAQLAATKAERDKLRAEVGRESWGRPGKPDVVLHQGHLMPDGHKGSQLLEPGDPAGLSHAQLCARLSAAQKDGDALAGALEKIKDSEADTDPEPIIAECEAVLAAWRSHREGKKGGEST